MSNDSKGLNGEKMAPAQTKGRCYVLSGRFQLPFLCPRYYYYYAGIYTFRRNFLVAMSTTNRRQSAFSAWHCCFFATFLLTDQSLNIFTCPPPSKFIRKRVSSQFQARARPCRQQQQLHSYANSAVLLDPLLKYHYVNQNLVTIVAVWFFGGRFRRVFSKCSCEKLISSLAIIISNFLQNSQMYTFYIQLFVYL